LPQTGDQIRVTVWPQSAFGPPFVGIVDASGNIVLPPIGIVDVARIPIGQLRDSLLIRLTKYIREPEVDVQVLRRVTINGAVMRPDIYFMDVSATLRDVIAKAGGINEEVGNKKKVSIVRNGIRINVPGWESDTTSTSVLRSGDQVLVGRRSWLEINIIPVASLSLATASFLLSLRHH
jgi:polysaccharide export outer membrane protein